MSTQTTETLSQQIIELVSEYIDIPKQQITLDSYFTTDLSFDSLDIAEFVMLVEDKFDIEISSDEGETIKTVRDAVQTIQKLIA